MHGRIILSTFILLFTSLGWAGVDTTCIKHADLETISQNFSQLKQFVGKQAEYCPGDFSEQWFKIARSLDVLLNIDPREAKLDQDDALTFKAITEQDWWAYFTKRANKFEIQANCQPNVVAYVMPFFGSGLINLCPPFFNMTVSSQASVMMHEVRHFDGHRHVTCSQGNEKGNGGACDSEITGKGSYAISVQTLVGMARSADTKAEEKPSLEAEAVYMAFNKFNVVPKVKMNNAIILSSAAAEVYAWDLDAGLTKISDLPEPSIVINSANNLTVYPVDTNSEAYRKDNKFLALMDNPGLYAKHYNSETPTEREKYKSISYFAPGGLLKDNTLLTLCNQQNLKLAPTNLDSKGSFVAIISFSTDALDQRRESALLASNGDLYRFDCVSSSSDSVRFEKMQEVMEMPKGKSIVESFGFDGQQYALMDSGELAIVDTQKGSMQVSTLNFPTKNQDWVSATPMSIPEVF